VAAAAPAAYAHVVAQRYRKLVDTWGGSDTNSSVRSGGMGPNAPKPIQALPELKLKPEYSMFFC
jgi:eukaryotic translation initiation factor 2C